MLVLGIVILLGVGSHQMVGPFVAAHQPAISLSPVALPLYTLRTFDRYQCFIDADLEPFYPDSEIAVSGLNTARAFTWKNGRINRQQLEKLRMKHFAKRFE